MNQKKKQEFHFLYASDNVNQKIETSIFIEMINETMKNESVHIVMEMPSDIQGYEAMSVD